MSNSGDEITRGNWFDQQTTYNIASTWGTIRFTKEMLGKVYATMPSHTTWTEYLKSSPGAVEVLAYIDADMESALLAAEIDGYEQATYTTPGKLIYSSISNRPSDTPRDPSRASPGPLAQNQTPAQESGTRSGALSPTNNSTPPAQKTTVPLDTPFDEWTAYTLRSDLGTVRFSLNNLKFLAQAYGKTSGSTTWELYFSSDPSLVTILAHIDSDPQEAAKLSTFEGWDEATFEATGSKVRYPSIPPGPDDPTHVNADTSTPSTVPEGSARAGALGSATPLPAQGPIGHTDKGGSIYGRDAIFDRHTVYEVNSTIGTIRFTLADMQTLVSAYGIQTPWSIYYSTDPSLVALLDRVDKNVQDAATKVNIEGFDTARFDTTGFKVYYQSGPPTSDLTPQAPQPNYTFSSDFYYVLPTGNEDESTHASPAINFSHDDIVKIAKANHPTDYEILLATPTGINTILSEIDSDGLAAARIVGKGDAYAGAIFFPPGHVGNEQSTSSSQTRLAANATEDEETATRLAAIADNARLRHVTLPDDRTTVGHVGDPFDENTTYDLWTSQGVVRLTLTNMEALQGIWFPDEQWPLFYGSDQSLEALINKINGGSTDPAITAVAGLNAIRALGLTGYDDTATRITAYVLTHHKAGDDLSNDPLGPLGTTTRPQVPSPTFQFDTEFKYILTYSTGNDDQATVTLGQSDIIALANAWFAPVTAEDLANRDFINKVLERIDSDQLAALRVLHKDGGLDGVTFAPHGTVGSVNTNSGYSRIPAPNNATQDQEQQQRARAAEIDDQYNNDVADTDDPAVIARAKEYRNRSRARAGLDPYNEGQTTWTVDEGDEPDPAQLGDITIDLGDKNVTVRDRASASAHSRVAESTDIDSAQGKTKDYLSKTAAQVPVVALGANPPKDHLDGSNRPYIQIIQGDSKPKYDRFILTGLTDNSSEKLDAVETFGSPHLFASGRFIKRLVLNGSVRCVPRSPGIYTVPPSSKLSLEDLTVPDHQVFRYFYDNYLRGTELANRGAIAVLYVDGDEYTGVFQNLGYTRDSHEEQFLSWSMNMLVLSFKSKYDADSRRNLGRFQSLAQTTPRFSNQVAAAHLANSIGKCYITLGQSNQPTFSNGFEPQILTTTLQTGVIKADTIVNVTSQATYLYMAGTRQQLKVTNTGNIRGIELLGDGIPINGNYTTGASDNVTKWLLGIKVTDYAELYASVSAPTEINNDEPAEPATASFSISTMDGTAVEVNVNVTVDVAPTVRLAQIEVSFAQGPKQTYEIKEGLKPIVLDPSLAATIFSNRVLPFELRYSFRSTDTPVKVPTGTMIKCNMFASISSTPDEPITEHDNNASTQSDYTLANSSGTFALSSSVPDAIVTGTFTLSQELIDTTESRLLIADGVSFVFSLPPVDFSQYTLTPKPPDLVLFAKYPANPILTGTFTEARLLRQPTYFTNGNLPAVDGAIQLFVANPASMAGLSRPTSPLITQLVSTLQITLRVDEYETLTFPARCNAKEISDMTKSTNIEWGKIEVREASTRKSVLLPFRLSRGTISRSDSSMGRHDFSYLTLEKLDSPLINSGIRLPVVASHDNVPRFVPR